MSKNYVLTDREKEFVRYLTKIIVGQGWVTTRLTIPATRNATARINEIEAFVSYLINLQCPDGVTIKTGVRAWPGDSLREYLVENIRTAKRNLALIDIKFLDS